LRSPSAIFLLPVVVDGHLRSPAELLSMLDYLARMRLILPHLTRYY
jgi:hypothetical protein